jgi:tRNA(Ile)-lysidine synthase
LEKPKLIDCVTDTIRRHAMLTGGEKVVVGLSGGPDSVCLLVLLDQLKERFNLQLHAMYVDHGLRPDETPGEILSCEKICRQLGIPFVVRSTDVRAHAEEHRLNRQEAARQLRYHCFHEIVSKITADTLALAHNADDQAETVLMRLLRGSGPAGLSGIPVKRGNIIRPLIETERSEIELFLEQNNITYIVDSSNMRTDYLRNRIRKTLMPELRRINPEIIRSIQKTTLILQEEERYFEIIVTKTLMKLVSRKSTNRLELFLAPLEMMEHVILRRVLRRALDATESLRGISFIHIEDMMNLIKSGKAGDRIYLPRNIRVIKEYALLVITSESPPVLTDYEIQPPGEAVLTGTGSVVKARLEENSSDAGDGKSVVLLDAGKMVFPLKIRARKPGDFFYPHGFGKKKKLQDFFVDEKVPRDERASVPVVVSGSDIVWIAGYRADHRFRITDQTKKFLRLVIVKGRF